MISKHVAATAVMAFCAVASQPSFATIATSNLNNLLISGAPVSPTGFRAQSFTVANDQNYELTDIQVLFSSNATNVFLNVYADGASHPGAPLEQLTFTSSLPTTATAANLSTIAADLLTFSSTGLTLTAGTTYWVVAGLTTAGSSPQWYGTNGLTETGLPGWSIANTNQFSTNAGASWSNNVGTPMYLGINAVDSNAAAVPEPGTLALMGIASLGVLRRRKAT